MFPIRDHNPSSRTPYVTYALIAINIAVFLSYYPFATNQAALASVFANWAMVPQEISSGQDLYTLVTSLFLHAGWMHLAGNMLFLWIFGDNLEDMLGHAAFALFYLASGLGADLAHWAADPGSAVPTVGASGAIAGVMGGYLLLFPKARIDILLILIIFFKVFSVPAWLMLGLWFAFQVVNGYGTDITGGGVAYWAHAGGFVLGFLLVIPVWLRLGGTGFWSRNHGQPPHPEAKYVLTKTRIPKVVKRN